jgi:glycosyltransferase involved in cell wall biosynthesis
MNPIKILHTTTTIGKSSFGIGQISVSLASAQQDLNNDVSIWCLDNKENILWASEKHGFPPDFITGFELAGPKKLWFSPDIKRKARSSGKQSFDIIHQHGIWTGASSATLIFAREKGIPTVVAPHGSLNKWVLNLSAWKKKIALASYERANLRLASCLHATSENEITDFRDYGLKNPIAYIGNGIQEKYLNITGNAARFREQYSIPGNQRILLFLARISPKKGLVMLINSIDSIRDEFRDWQFIIAGVDEFNHKKDVEALISELHLEDRIKIIGSLFDQSKNDAFAAAELFILPSHSEGSPMVVLDSLAAGVPVITTKASSWGDLNDFNCGWWTDISISSIGKALKEALAMSARDLQVMGDNGKKIIASKYTWQELAKKTIRLYNWLLQRDEKPDFVTLD